MTLTGGCYCGRVRYEVDGAPWNVTVCHCVDCRRVAGAPMVGWLTVRPVNLRFGAEAPARFVSSPGVARSFCPACGTPLTFQKDGDNEVDVTVCSLDDPGAVTPADHVWTERQVDWVRLADGLPRHARSRNG